MPSDEIPPLLAVGTSVAMSGTMLRLSSKRQRLSRVFCTSSVSTSASIAPGSQVLGSWNVGNFSTYFDASAAELDDDEPPPHAATVMTLKSPRAIPPTLNRLIPKTVSSSLPISRQPRCAHGPPAAVWGQPQRS